MQLCNYQNCDTGSKLVEGKQKLEQIQEVSQRKTDLVEVSNKTENVFFKQFVTHLYVEAVTQRIFIDESIILHSFSKNAYFILVFYTANSDFILSDPHGVIQIAFSTLLDRFFVVCRSAQWTQRSTICREGLKGLKTELVEKVGTGQEHGWSPLLMVGSRRYCREAEVA